MIYSVTAVVTKRVQTNSADCKRKCQKLCNSVSYLEEVLNRGKSYI